MMSRPINRKKSLPDFTTRGCDLQAEPLQQAHSTGVQAVPSERQAAFAGRMMEVPSEGPNGPLRAQ